MFSFKTKVTNQAMKTIKHFTKQTQSLHSEDSQSQGSPTKRDNFLELYLNRKMIAAQRRQKPLVRKRMSKLPRLIDDINQRQASLANKETIDSNHQALYVSDYFVAKDAEDKLLSVTTGALKSTSRMLRALFPNLFRKSHSFSNSGQVYTSLFEKHHWTPKKFTED
jgi:hypothetical protein